MITKRYIKPILFLLTVVFVVSNPYIIIQGVKNSLLICYENIIPSLFVVMVLADYANQHDILNFLGLPLRWYSKLMKVDSKDYSSYLVLSMIGGFAIGAKFLNEMKKNGYSQNALSVLGVSMINNSLGFCVFAVGAGLLNNYFIGLFLYISTMLASIISAFLLSFTFKYNIVSANFSNDKKPSSIAKSINNSVNSILSVCGFVVIFSTLCEAILLYINKYDILSVIFAIFTEITYGCIKISEFYGLNSYFFCIALSFLPICTLCQVYYFTDNLSLIKTLLLSRIIHTPISLLIFSVLINLFPIAFHTMSVDSVIFKTYSYSGELSFTLFIICLLLIKILDKNKLFTNR